MADIASTRREIVYLMQIGRAVKIGYTASIIKNRIAAFRTGTAEEIHVLAEVEGGRALEKRLHGLLTDIRIRGELFRLDWRIDRFIEIQQAESIDDAIRFLEDTTPRKRQQRKDDERSARTIQKRTSEKAKDEKCLELVRDRKRRLGW